MILIQLKHLVANVIEIIESKFYQKQIYDQILYKLGSIDVFNNKIFIASLYSFSTAKFKGVVWGVNF